jgi:UDP-N-acetylmuramoylalanine--D-glutamate ligase
MKPFDCVGTFQEAQTALFLAKKTFADSFIMRQIGDSVAYYPEVFDTNKNTSIPEKFRFLGMEKALIAGFGKEGKITKQYLRKQYPKLRLGIADAKEGSDYLKKQAGVDIAVKTPGIKKELITIPYTTATNIFFSKIKNKNLIIGITGSKGKSTTSTLIYQILKTAGKNVRLLGNIGSPMLQDLLKPINKDTIFVLELSSAQLDDITFSPDIAVVTNLFPEHMDYHGNLENYYQAKKNIIRYQGKNDYFVYDPQNKKVSAWRKNYQGNAIPFAKNIPLKDGQIPLLGKHNKNNIKAAVAVAHILGIPQQTIKKTIKNFKGLAHRLEFVGQYQGISFYDDAISTTPESTIMAIKSLPHIGTLFLGGTNRGYNFTLLEKIIKKYAIKNIVLFPDSGSAILTQTQDLNILKIPTTISGNAAMKKAVLFAYKYTPKGTICLLSCASPSYSLWKNFEEKGDQFKKIVTTIGKQ